MDESKLLSITKIAEKLERDINELRTTLVNAGLLEQKDDKTWILTKIGEIAGGVYRENSRVGRYIAWPESLLDHPAIGGSGNADDAPVDFLSSTKIGHELGLPPSRVNSLLSELGWIEKALKGWKLTKQGEKQGGLQKEHRRSGVPFVIWPKNLLNNKSLIESAKELLGKHPEPSTEQVISQDTGFREKYEAKHRATDGHFVRSKAEMLIDNWLYMAEIVHAYERKLPIEENVYCDFYIPTGKVYIEYWGLEKDAKYRDRKAQKIAIYEKYGFNLIQLQDADVQNLDDVLPRLLLKFDVQSY
jgi:hypothetical protein